MIFERSGAPRAVRDLGGAACAVALFSLFLLLSACSTVGRRIDASTGRGPRTQVGDASWYGRLHQGRRTASGERFDEHAMTAAHPYFPLGSRLRVTNLENGRSVVVRVNDRGPFVRGRIVDLSYAAARRLGITGRGVARVRIKRLS